MNNLKKQLHEKSSVDPSQAENQARTQSQEQAASSNKKNQNKSSQKDSGTVKELPYTPGVLLKFHCQNQGVTKKELRVREKKLKLDLGYVVLKFLLSYKFSNSFFLVGQVFFLRASSLSGVGRGQC